MLAKSLQILIGTALLALLAVVVFAVLQLSGPKDTIDEAARLASSGELQRATALLDLAEPSVAGDPPLRDRLLRLRYAANQDLQLYANALRDVELLLRANPADSTLQLDRVRLLALAGRGDEALDAARTFLDANPGHGRALELAGEACQVLYQPTLKAVVERCERELPSPDRADARVHLWSYLYRPAGDPQIAVALDALAALFMRDPRLQASWHDLANELARLRERVQEALAYFRGSLEADGEPVAAFEAFALSLDQSQRIDDLLAACEIHRRRFTHQFVDAAGADAAWALVREGHHPAALATAERWLLRGPGPSRTEFPDGTRDLLLARTWAAYHVGTPDAIARARKDAEPAWRVQPVPVVAPLTAAISQLQWKLPAEAEKSLRFATDLLARAPMPIDRYDLLPPVASLWLDLLRRRDAPEADLEQPLRTWAAARPGSLAPVLARAAMLQERGQRATALATLAEARTQAPDDEALFARYLAAMRLHAEAIGQDGPTLLSQCRRRGVTVPVVRHDLAYLLCGETALEQGELEIAVGCAGAAVDAFRLARPPRLLQVRAAMAAGRHAEAARQADHLLQRMPADAETVALALAAHRAAGGVPARVLAVALSAGDVGPALQAELLRAAVAERPRGAIAFVTPFATAPDAPVETRLAAAAAIAHTGDAARAARLLDGALAQPGEWTAAARVDVATAFAAWISAAAATTADAALALAAEPRLAAIGTVAPAAAPAWLATARSIAPTHPTTALALATAATAVADVEDRTGSDMVLLGELALRAGRWRLAEEHWTAALAFADGVVCAERLARLCFARDRAERALQVEALVAQPTDAALAARCGRIERGARLVAADLVVDPSDLLTHCTLSLAGQSLLTDWRPVSDGEAQGLLELLSLLHEPALAPLALPRVRALSAASGPRHTNRLLLARALAAAGDGAGASAIHAALPRSVHDDPVFLHEVAVAARAPGYELTPDLKRVLLGAITTAAVTTSPVTLAFAAQLYAAAFVDRGHAAFGAELRWMAWLQGPHARPLTAADRAWLAAGQRPADAVHVFGKALDGPHPCDRPATIDALFGAAPAVAAARPAQRGALVATARRLLASDGALGSVVHFLLAHDDTLRGGAAAERRQQLLRSHLERVAAGRDGTDHLDATLAMLQRELGVAALLAEVERHLQAHPTALELWVARTRLSLGGGNARPAVAALRSVLRHADAPELQLAMLAWAAEARLATADDVVLLTRLPQPLRDSPEGRYVAAVLALRAGNPDAALPLLADVPARADGMHLFVTGLAALQSRAGNGVERARAAFAELARDYASSSVARNAGSFASQLADR